MKLTDFSETEFPIYPDEELSNSNLRKAYASAGAYLTMALEVADISHTRSQEAALVTDMTHELEDRTTAEEYIQLCFEELGNACVETTHSVFKSELEQLREEVGEIQF